ncbi:MAG: hypothetical protein A2168_09435 [Planctomycetes bacterium RBG_13_50_24]|nr:MAG: hypothetical protein A2168_09435 [Planctomycetes bacterium RBG_13_50_24]
MAELYHTTTGSNINFKKEMNRENREITVKTTNSGFFSMMLCYRNTHAQNIYTESKPGGRPVDVFSAMCGLAGFVRILRHAGIALLFHPSVDFGDGAGLDIGKRRLVRDIFQFVRIFGRAVQLLGGPVHVSLDEIISIGIVPGVAYPRCPVRIVQLSFARPDGISGAFGNIVMRAVRICVCLTFGFPVRFSSIFLKGIVRNILYPVVVDLSFNESEARPTA